jgi:hypothetical protein
MLNKEDKEYQKDFVLRLRGILYIHYADKRVAMTFALKLKNKYDLDNILSGRKKMDAYSIYWLKVDKPEIDLNWLITGNGKARI